MKVDISDTEYMIQVFSISRSDLGSGSGFEDLLCDVGCFSVVDFRFRRENESVRDNGKENLLDIRRNDIVSAVQVSA